MVAVYPANHVTETIAHITQNDGIIVIRFAEYRNDFREAMRFCGFSWNTQKRRWERLITKHNGPIEDRMAEVGNNLLNAGIPIAIENEGIREAAINAAFQPEQTRWVFVDPEDQCFVIRWNKRRENFYDAARRIPGSRYSKRKRTVIVPKEMFTEVVDFADMYGFVLSEEAQKLVEQAHNERMQRLIVVPAQPKQATHPSNMPQKLEVPEEVMIDEELRDDD